MVMWSCGKVFPPLSWSWTGRGRQLGGSRVEMPWREKGVQSGSAGPSVMARGGEALWRCREILHILTFSVWTPALELHRALFQEYAQPLVPGSALQQNFTYKYLGSSWHSKLLQHSKTCQCHLACLPAQCPLPWGQSPTLMLPQGGMSTARIAGGNPPFLMPLGALRVCSLPARGEKGLERKRSIAGEQSCPLTPCVCPAGEPQQADDQPALHPAPLRPLHHPQRDKDPRYGTVPLGTATSGNWQGFLHPPFPCCH